MSDQNDGEGQKWICNVCTFENWPKSIRCTMCRTTLNQLIENSTCNQSDEEEDQDEMQKWSCSLCTYLNWPKSLKCVQCLTKRSDHVIESNRNKTNSTNSAAHKDAPMYKHTATHSNTSDCDKSHKPRLNDQPKAIELDAIDVKLHKPETESGFHSNTIDNNSEVQSDAKNYQLSKWNCTFCSYENWPKAYTCVMCKMPKIPSQSATISAEKSLDNSYITTSESSSIRKSHLCSEDMQESSSHSEINSFNIKNSKLITQSTITNHPLIRRLSREKIDCCWLEACIGIVNGDAKPVKVYLQNGGDLARQLTLIETNLLNRPSAFEVGYTLVHLAIRFKRTKILELLLENRDVSRVKRVPCSVSINFASELRKHVGTCFKQRKGDFPCTYVTEFATFALPQEIDELNPSTQQRLFDELLDRDVQKELEQDSSIINWSYELSVRLNSRLYALWNRSTGDCLLDSCLQATWSLFDKENRLRKALADALSDASVPFFARFRAAEMFSDGAELSYTLDRLQWEADWAMILSLAAQPGQALERFHVFALAHVLRRPIIVYGVKYVKSFRGETLGFAGFQGIYLPLHWEPSFCTSSPIALGYTRGHFTALVPMDSVSSSEHVSASTDSALHCRYLPLVNSDHELLPLHFLTESEIGREEELLRQYLDCCVTENGTLVAKQKITRNPYLMQQMIGEWLDHYRSVSLPKTKSTSTSDSSTAQRETETERKATIDYSSDQDSD